MDKEKYLPDLNDMEKIRLDKLNDLKENGKNPFIIENYDVKDYSEDIIENYLEKEGQKVIIAGRMMFCRKMGKASFINIQDYKGKIQVYVKRDNIGEEEYTDFKTYDIGDILGIEGEVFKTKTGEITINADKVTLLSKSLRILPEKYHGLKDIDLRYRMRYLDLIMNPDVKEVFLKRNKAIKAMKEYLDNKGFLEVETPTLATIAGGAAARPFITHHNTLDIDMYLRIANELYLKRLIVGGFDKVYEMGKMFRNEGMDINHNPEYTAIELYQAYADYEEMMRHTENIVSTMAMAVAGTTKLEYDGKTIDFKAPWKRISMVDAIKEYAGVDFNTCETFEEAKKLAEEHEIEVTKDMGKGKIIEEFFDKYCEDMMIQPTFVTHHPTEISPLAKRNPDNPEYTNRFEAFANGWEIANAFSELNDPIDQRARFVDQLKQRELGDDEAHMLDEDFLYAIELGLPPTGGLGIGVDRVIMLLTGAESIRDVILFPTMKPTEDEKYQNKKMIEITKEETKTIDLSKVKIEPLFEDMVDFDTFSKSDFRVVKVKNCEEVPKSNKLLKFTLDDGTGKDRIILSGIRNYYSPAELIGKTLVAIVNLPPRKMMGVDSEGMIISAICDYDGEEKLNLIMLDNNIPAGAKLY